MNSSANFQLTSVSESQFEDISGGFPLSINFTSSVLSDSAPNGTMRSDWIKLSISDANGASVDVNGDPIFSISNGIWVVDENNAEDSYWIILEESIPASQMLNISAPENYKGSISIDAQAMTSLATSNVADVTAQTQTVSFKVAHNHLICQLQHELTNHYLQSMRVFIMLKSMKVKRLI